MVGWVFFRAASFAAAWRVLAGMAGLTGGNLEVFHVPGEHLPLIFAAVALSWFGPNTQQIMAGLNWVQSAPENKPEPVAVAPWSFRPNLQWACWLGLLFVAALMQLSSDSEFLYFQF
jgi:hypothetical protein